MILQWSIVTVAAIVAIVIYVRYKQPSDMPAPLKASYALQVLKRIHTYIESTEDTSRNTRLTFYGMLEPYMKDIQLGRRERRDIVAYMLEKDWIYRDPPGDEYSFIVSSAGYQEIDTSAGARQIVADAVADLSKHRIESLKEKAGAAAAVALAMHIDANSASISDPAAAEQQARSIEDAVRSRDPEKIDKIITRTRDILQSISYAYQIFHGLF